MRRQICGLMAVLALAVSSTGCTSEIVGRLDGLDIAAVLFGSAKTGGSLDPNVARMINASMTLGQSILGALMGLLGLYCGYQAINGKPWLPILKELFIPTTFCLYVQRFSFSEFGLSRLIYEGGVNLGERYAPPGGVFATWVLQYSQVITRPMLDARDATTTSDALYRLAEGVYALLASQWIPLLIAFNCLGTWMVKMMYHAWFALALGIHVVLLPLVVVFVVYPPLRSIFTGFLKSFIAVGLWPMFFGILESFLVALPMGTWIGVGQGRGLTWIVALVQGNLLLVMINWAFFVSMGLACVLSYGLMFGGPKIIAKIF